MLRVGARLDGVRTNCVKDEMHPCIGRVIFDGVDNLVVQQPYLTCKCGRQQLSAAKNSILAA
eukprot:12922469-Ditylum_brightwellii.AAC.1